MRTHALHRVRFNRHARALQTALSNAGIRPGGTYYTDDVGNALANAWGLANPPVVQCTNGYITQASPDCSGLIVRKADTDFFNAGCLIDAG